MMSGGGGGMMSIFGGVGTLLPLLPGAVFSAFPG